ncbi:ABC transporter permease [Catalinimonas niigatensis]|uniref:ABC transporter permease n=1 Tax=Catalinimonas niigatensis TaxID=1397264 RepID=UPI0026652A68|nr:FtsX-like permease family protein [Catalinimonas niigatensis]WPP50867.1 FtsX-like permease family protein [Catalinimonas niigatensis]
MFFDYKLAFRYLRKIKAMSLINISGLALGIIACLFIVHFVKMESVLYVFPQKNHLNERSSLGSNEEAEISQKILKGFEQLTPEVSRQNIYSEVITSNEHLSYQYIMGAGAIFVLVILGVNIVSFTTVRSAKRAPEKGMRKTLETLRRYLSWQFLTESLFISFISLLVSIIALQFILPYFNQAVGFSLTIDEVLSSLSLSYLLFGVILLGILSGLYPTLFLACFKPSVVLKSSFSQQRAWLKKSLIAFQFCISLFMIIGSIIIFEQLDYLTHKKLALVQQQRIVVPRHEENLSLETSVNTKTEILPELKDAAANTTLASCPFYLPRLRKAIDFLPLNMYTRYFVDDEFFGVLKAFLFQNVRN